MQVIEEVADEGSSFYPRIEFADEYGVAMVPASLYWRLTDPAGNVVNGRAEVEVETPEDALTIALAGADLAVMGDAVAARILTVWGTYTSALYEEDRPFSFQVLFNVAPRVGG